MDLSLLSSSPPVKSQTSWDLAGISSQVVVRLPSVLAQEGSVQHCVAGRQPSPSWDWLNC